MSKLTQGILPDASPSILKLHEPPESALVFNITIHGKDYIFTQYLRAMDVPPGESAWEAIWPGKGYMTIKPVDGP